MIHGGVTRLMGGSSHEVGTAAARGVKFGALGGALDSVVKETRIKKLKASIKKWQDDLKDASPSLAKRLQRQIKNAEQAIKQQSK